MQSRPTIATLPMVKVRISFRQHNQSRFHPHLAGSTTSLQFIHYGERKRKAATESMDDEDNNHATSPPTKKPCQPSIPSKTKDKLKLVDDDNADVRTFTVHIQVFSTESITDPKRHGKAAKTTTTTKTVTRGPFKFDTSCSFANFQCEVANALPCRKALLPISKFEWKFDKESKSAPQKRLTDHAGFDALVKAIKKTRVTDNVVVWLRLPKPTKDEAVSPW